LRGFLHYKHFSFGQRARRGTEHPSFGGYPLPEYEPVEPRDESTAWSQVNPTENQYTEPSDQSARSGPENVDFFQRFSSYYNNPYQVQFTLTIPWSESP